MDIMLVYITEMMLNVFFFVFFFYVYMKILNTIIIKVHQMGHLIRQYRGTL